MSESNISSRTRIGRAAPLVGLAGRTAGEAVVTSLRRKKNRGQFHEKNADRYAEHLGRSKGVLMKAGQILSFTMIGSAIPDSNQSVYQRALARLQDDAPPMPFEMAADVIQAELGARPSELFTEFDPVPLGAASIGQVHAARLHDGRRVAVKIQYPGVDEAIRADLKNAELLVTFLQVMRGFLPGSIQLDVREVAAEVSERIGEEVDYLIEAKNQKEFADIYRDHPFVRIPDVVDEFSTGRVLTMDLAQGKRFAEALEAPHELRNTWAEVLSRFALGTVRRAGLFHADPHPGNYLFHDDGTVTFLDFGCVKRFESERVRYLQAALNAAVDDDVDAMWAAAGSLGFLSGAVKPAPQRMLEWFRVGLEFLTGPQPYDCSTADELVGVKMSPIGPYKDVIGTITIDPAYAMLMRIQIGLNSILGALGAVGPWEALRSEWDRGGPPATPLGEIDMAFWSAKT